MEMQTTGRIESINVSPGGVPKTPVLQARIGTLGLEGDHQRNTSRHGGTERAVVLYSLDVIAALRKEGHPIGVGTTGENLTISGLEWAALTPGARLTIGEVALEIRSYASPCETIRHSFTGEDFMRISQKTHPGWSRLCARVMAGGLVQPGDAVVWEAL